VSAESLKAQRERVVEHLLELAELPADAARDNRDYWRIGLRELQRTAYELGFTAGMRTQAGEVAIDAEDYCFRDGVWQPDIDKLLDRGE